MKSKKSIINQFASAEDYIKNNSEAFKIQNPKLTCRQIQSQLRVQWKQELQKYQNIPNKKEKPDLKDIIKSEEIYIPIEPSKNQTKVQTIPNKKKNTKKKKNYKKKQSKKKPSKNTKKNVVKDKSNISLNQLDLQSLEEGVQNLQLDVGNQQQVENENAQNLSIINEKSYNNQIAQQEQKNNKKQNKVLLKQMEILSKPIDFENVSDDKPIPIQDFINSANSIKHISIIQISENKTNQGQVGIDQIKSIKSHTYGIFNHYNDTSNLNLQLFFEIEFEPRKNGTYPLNTFCTAKQAALYNENLVKKYIISKKHIFTKDFEYYIK